LLIRFDIALPRSVDEFPVVQLIVRWSALHGLMIT
jgi:hypothetical protein